METTGKVIQVLPMQSGTSANGKQWSVQGFVIETHDQYPKKQYIELFGEERIKENIPNIDDEVTASVDIESREFNGRWYTSVRAWKVTKGTAQPAAQPMVAPATQVANPAPAVPKTGVDAEGTKLPF